MSGHSYCSSGRMLHRGERQCNRSGQRDCVSLGEETVEGERRPSASPALPTKPYLTRFASRPSDICWGMATTFRRRPTFTFSAAVTSGLMSGRKGREAMNKSKYRINFGLCTCVLIALLLVPIPCYASDANHGASFGGAMLSIYMNILYAARRAQGRTTRGWEILIFILGLPLTLLTQFVVEPGSERAYGIDLPRKRE